MVIASDLRVGMALRIDGQPFKVLEVEAKAGAAKMGGLVRTKVRNVKSGRLWEQNFRPQERLEDLEFERHRMEFLYSDGQVCTFQRLDNFEQVELPSTTIGAAEKFLQPGMEFPVEFFEGEPIDIVLPDLIECRVASTSPPARSQQDSSRKEAILENGLSIQVPLFIGPEEIVRIDLRTGRYVERVRTEHKRGA